MLRGFASYSTICLSKSNFYQEIIETNYVSYPFPRTEPENLENFLGAKFRAERVKRHHERLNLRQPTNLQSERRAKKSSALV